MGAAPCQGQASDKPRLAKDGPTAAVGNSADCVVLDCPDRESAVAELSPPIYGFKPDYMTFSREPRGRSDCGERPWVYPPCLPRAEPDGLPLGLLPVGRCASDVGLLARELVTAMD